MRIVVTGSKGQVVRSLIERARPDQFEVVPLVRTLLDLASGPESIGTAIVNACPDVIVSAAAYTKGDEAETERDLAFRINEAGPRAIAMAASSLAVPLIHLSTDYVFNGRKGSPYVETDETGPSGVYGASKLAGEAAVREEHANSTILRTAWVFSPFGGNFVKTILHLARESDEIGIVSDQRGNPTSALDIADGILRVAQNLHDDAQPSKRGIFHMRGKGEAIWAEFAEAILAASAELGGPSAHVRPIRTADYPTAATRPPNSRLDSSKLAEIHGVSLPDWRSSVKGVVARLLRSSQES